MKHRTQQTSDISNRAEHNNETVLQFLLSDIFDTVDVVEFDIKYQILIIIKFSRILMV